MSLHLFKDVKDEQSDPTIFLMSGTLDLTKEAWLNRPSQEMNWNSAGVFLQWRRDGWKEISQRQCLL